MTFGKLYTTTQTIYCHHRCKNFYVRFFVLIPPPPLKTAPKEYCFRVCPSVSERVSLCVTKTLWAPYLKNQWRKFQTVLVTDVFGFVFVPIRFWGQKSKVKVTPSNDPKTLWTSYLKNQWREFHPVLVYRCIRFVVLISFLYQRSRSQQVMTPKPSEYNIFTNIWAYFTKIRWCLYQGLGHTN